MKVLLTATVQSHICQFHKTLVSMLHDNGCEVHSAAKNNLGEKNGLKLDFTDKVYDVCFNRSPFSKDNIKAYRQIKRIIAEGNYDIIHCNTPVAGILTRLAAKKSRKNGTRVVYTAHGFHFYKGASRKNWIIYYPIERFFAKHYTDLLITVNTEDYYLAKSSFDCPVSMIHGVGVDSGRYLSITEEEKACQKSRMGYKNDQKIILLVGELLPNKNQQMAIRMLKELTKSHENVLLIIAGNGRDKENLKKLAAELELSDKVQFVGYTTHIEEYLHIADVYIACSRREGLPINIIEAMLSKVPVVATDNRGHREIIKNGENGYLIPVNDSCEMNIKVHKLLEDKALREEVCTKAMRSAQEYTSKRVYDELYDIYHSQGLIK